MPLSIYRSSAGSGKTYTLAKEYVKLLLNNPNQHSHILAVTFTNKATQEMKARIIAFLTRLANQSDDDLLNQLEEETLIRPKQIQLHAQIALNRILHDYSNFSVVTIDSFFNRVVKAFARELGLPIQMDLQLDTEAAMNDAYDRLMLSLSENQELQKWLAGYMLDKLENDRGWHIEREVKGLGEELFKEQYKQIESEIKAGSIESVNQLSQSLHAIEKQVETQMQEFGLQAFDILDSHQLTISDFAFGSSGVASYFGKWRHFSQWDQKIGKRATDAIDNSSKWHKKKDPMQATIESAFSSGLNELLKSGIAYWEVNKKAFYTAQLASQNLYALGILKQLEAQLKAYRDENDVVLISDQNQFINQIVRDAGLEFMYEKTGSRFNHYLIDEFQDTSAVQWQNFKPLIENAVAGGHHALLVGDAKQSIYRWRGGDMRLLLQQVATDLGVSTQDAVKNLNSNFRSHKNIIDFNNAFFNEIEQFVAIQNNSEPSPLLQLAFADVEQQLTPQTKPGGFVKLKTFQNNREDDTKAKDLIDSELLSEIQSLKSEGFTYGEMAVLVFKNKEASRVAQLLNAANIPVQSSESLFLSQSQAIQLIIAAFRFLVDPSNELHRATLLSALYQTGHFTDIPHQALSQCGSQNLDAFLEEIPDDLSSLVLSGNYKDLFRLFSQLIDAFRLTEIDGAYVQSLGETLLDFQTKNDSSLQNFLEWWDEKGDKLSIQVPEGDDAVVIQTVHKAKGLQYPIVLMPYISKGTKPKHNQIIWAGSEHSPYSDYGFLPIHMSSKAGESYFEAPYQLECDLTVVDTLNALYVAFTRAEQRLYLLADLSLPTETPIAKWLAPRMSQISNVISKSDDWMEFGSTNQPKFKVNPYHRGSELKKVFVNQGGAQLQLAESKLNFTSNEGKRQKGIVLHRILSYIQQPQDTEQALHRALYEGIIVRDELTEYREQLVELFSIDDIQPVFDANATTLLEREILTSQGIYRPDRVLMTTNSVLVADFKTGEPQKRDLHQVKHYAKLVKTMLPHLNITVCLVYLDTKTLVRSGI